MGHLVPYSLLVTLPKLKNLKMKAVAILLLAGLAMTSASALPKAAKTQLSYEQVMKAKGVGCDICTLVVTEIDQLGSAIGGLFPGSGAACNALVETYLPQIIEGLVNNQLSPASVCGLLTLCP